MYARRHLFTHLVAARTAPWMFVVSLVFLVCQAILVVIWFDIPNLTSPPELPSEGSGRLAERALVAVGSESVDHRVHNTAFYLIILMWPLFIAEAIFHWWTRPWNEEMRKYHFLDALFCICPSIRMCARSPEMGNRLWLPGLGWRQANKRLRRRMERHFSVPMIVIALMMLPLLLVEQFMKPQIMEYWWLRLLIHLSTGTIWFAFAFEFILMFSVAEKKITYCKTHWLDIAIIALPLISYLRSLRLMRATQVTRMIRVYRMRGTAVRAVRALVLLDFFQRIIRTDVDQRIEKLQKQLNEMELEAKQIRRQIAKLERERDEQESTGQQDSGPAVE